MSYSVYYSTKGIARYRSGTKKKVLRRFLLGITVAGACFTLFCAPVRNRLIQVFFPGDHAVTKEAATQMIADIRDGQPVREAVSAFCQEILNYDIP